MAKRFCKRQDWRNIRKCVEDELSIIASSSSSADSSDSELSLSDAKPKSIPEKLASWAVICGISHAHLNWLLEILGEHECFSTMHRDSRTFLKAPRSIEIKPMASGEYCHFGSLSAHEMEKTGDSLPFTGGIIDGQSESLLEEFNHAGSSSTKNRSAKVPVRSENNLGSSLAPMVSPGMKKDPAPAEASVINVPEPAYKRLLSDVNTIKANQRAILENQDVIMNLIKNKENSACRSSSVLQPEIEEVLDLLPLRTEADMSALEEGLAREGVLDGMLQYLKGIGNGDVDQVVRHMLRRLMSDEEATKYSFLGRRGKRTFQGTLLYKLVLGAVKLRFPDAYEYPVVTSIKNWLRHSTARHTKRGLNKEI